MLRWHALLLCFGVAAILNMTTPSLGYANYSVKCFRTSPNWTFLYTNIPLTSRSTLQFAVKARSQAIISMTRGADAFRSNMFEIVLGNTSTQFSVVRVKTNGPSVAQTSFTSNVVSNNSYTWFWLNWTTPSSGMQHLTVGTGCTTGQQTFLSYLNTPPFTLNFLYIASGNGAGTGEWAFPTDQFSAANAPPMTVSTEVMCTESRMTCGTSTSITTTYPTASDGTTSPLQQLQSSSSSPSLSGSSSTKTIQTTSSSSSPTSSVTSSTSSRFPESVSLSADSAVLTTRSTVETATLLTTLGRQNIDYDVHVLLIVSKNIDYDVTSNQNRSTTPSRVYTSMAEIGTWTNSAAAFESITMSTGSTSSSLSSMTHEGEVIAQSMVTKLISVDHGGLSNTETGNSEHVTLLELSDQTRLTATYAANSGASYISSEQLIASPVTVSKSLLGGSQSTTSNTSAYVTTPPMELTADTNSQSISSNMGTSKTCSEPPIITDATVQVFNDDIGMIAIYQCRAGKIFLSGGTSRTALCIGNGVWNVKISPCIVIQCLTTESAPATTILTSLSTSASTLLPPSFIRDVGSTLITSCNTTSGERFDDGTTRNAKKCSLVRGQTGVWNAPLYQCNVGNCRPPMVIENATILFTQSSRTLIAHCDVGHRFPTGLQTMSIQCGTDGHWEPPSHCGAVFCELPLIPANATELHWSSPDGSIVAQVPYNGTLTYGCVEGQKFEDGRSIKIMRCIGKNKWNDTLESCGVGRCDPVPTIIGAVSMVTDRALPGTLIHYTCQIGFQMSPVNASLWATCVAGEWLLSLANCTVVTCELSNLRRMKFNVTSLADGPRMTYGQSTEVSCYEGYRLVSNDVIKTTPLSGPMRVVCGESGVWLFNFKCQPINCEQPPSLRNADVLNEDLTTFPKNATANLTSFGDRVNYRCRLGFWLGRDVVMATVRCNPGGHWRSMEGSNRLVNEMTCTEITCLPIVTYEVNTTDSKIGVAVAASCGGKSAEVIHAVCTETGRWYPLIPECNFDNRSMLAARDIAEADYARTIGTGVIVAMTIMVVAVIACDTPVLTASVRELIAHTR